MYHFDVIASESLIHIFKKFDNGDVLLVELNKIYNRPIRLRTKSTWFTFNKFELPRNTKSNMIKEILQSICKIADENEINIYYEIDLYSKFYNDIVRHTCQFEFKDLSNSEMYRLFKKKN